MNIKDQLHRELIFKESPKRIVSLVPSQTELVCDMGLETYIVGITKFCVHPKHLKEHKKIVGGTKEVHYDRIKALNPDIILCNKEENTLEMIQQLEKIAPVHISDIYTIADCLELIAMYGRLFSKEEKSQEIILKIETKLENFIDYIKEQPKLTTAYFIWKKPWMVAAKGTFIDALLTLNKFDNYYGHLDRYPEIEMIEGENESVDLVLLSSEPFPFKEKHREVMRNYFPQAKIIVADGEAFSWYGSRLLKAFDYFKLLHRDLLISSVSN